MLATGTSRAACARRGPGSEAATIHAQDRKSNARGRVVGPRSRVISGGVMTQPSWPVKIAQARGITPSSRASGRSLIALALACATLWPGTLRAYEDQAGLTLQLGYAHATQ